MKWGDTVTTEPQPLGDRAQPLSPRVTPGGVGGGWGLVHPKDADSMAASGCGLEKHLVTGGGPFLSSTALF